MALLAVFWLTGVEGALQQNNGEASDGYTASCLGLVWNSCHKVGWLVLEVILNEAAHCERARSR